MNVHTEHVWPLPFTNPQPAMQQTGCPTGHNHYLLGRIHDRPCVNMCGPSHSQTHSRPHNKQAALLATTTIYWDVSMTGHVSTCVAPPIHKPTAGHTTNRLPYWPQPLSIGTYPWQAMCQHVWPLPFTNPQPATQQTGCPTGHNHYLLGRIHDRPCVNMCGPSHSQTHSRPHNKQAAHWPQPLSIGTYPWQAMCQHVWPLPFTNPQPPTQQTGCPTLLGMSTASMRMTDYLW